MGWLKQDGEHLWMVLQQLAQFLRTKIKANQQNVRIWDNLPWLVANVLDTYNEIRKLCEWARISRFQLDMFHLLLCLASKAVLLRHNEHDVSLQMDGKYMNINKHHCTKAEKSFTLLI
jgi:hypothetical protein